MITKFLYPLKRVGQYLRRFGDIRLLQSSDLFDQDWYLINNPDVANAKIDPLMHYLCFGGFEGRDPGPNFSSAWYLDTYKDVKRAGINPLVHYLKNGREEGRILNLGKIPHEYEKIANYKRVAWNSSAATDKYVQNVEHIFFNAITSDIFTKYLNSEDKVLDIGAGTGRLSFAIADIGCEVVSTDISESMLRVLEETKGTRKITSFLSDGDKIPVEDEQFDAVVSMDFMVHFANWQDFLKEKTRACKSGGFIIYNFYSGENLENISNNKVVASNYMANGEFIAHCTKNELQEVCDELGLEIVKLQPYNFLAENGLWFPNLTTEEVGIFFTLYRKSLVNEKILNVIKEFEHKIVENLSHEYCARMVVILRKKFVIREIQNTKAEAAYEVRMKVSNDDLIPSGLASHISQDINLEYQEKVINRIVTFYRRMKEAQKHASAPYQPGHKWRPEIEDRRAEYVSALSTKNTDELTKLFSNFYRNSGSYALLKYLPYQDLMKKSEDQGELISDFCQRILLDVETWKEYVMGNSLKDLQLPLIGNPYGCFVDDILITPASCPLHYYSYRVRELLDGIDMPIVAEIGGGFGCFAYYLLEPASQISYIDFDLPEIVVMAAYFLMMAFPEKKILLFGENIDLPLSPEVIREYNAILMPNFQLPGLYNNSVDLFINTHSLSEMDYHTVQEYSVQIARTCRLYFFHENSELEQNIGYGNVEVTASNFPIPRNIFKRIYKLNALWREPRYREYLYMHR